MRRLVFILALACCLTAFGQAFTPRRPFLTSSSGAWTPRSIPSLQYWWVATDIASNSIVTNWIDRIASFPASQDVEARRPTNSPNGVYFSGSNYLTNNPYNVNLCGTNVLGETSGTLFVICRPYANQDFAGIVTGGAAGNDGYGLSTRTPQWFNFAGGHIVNGNNFCAYATNAQYDVGIAFYYQWHGIAYTNGVLIGDTGEDVLGNFEAFGTHAVGNNYIGYITEIMSFTTTLDQSGITLLHNYATNTYWAQYQNYAFPISIALQPASVMCVTNSVVSFSLSSSNATGFQWRTNGINLISGDHWSGMDASTLWVTNDATLFTNLQVDCVLTNLLYTQTSAVAYLTVVSDLVTNGLVGWWRLDEGTGTSATDSSGTGNTGRLTNSPPWVIGKYNHALYFPYASAWGSSSFVRVTNSATLNSLSNFTLAAWVYSTNANADYAHIIVKKTTADGVNPTDPYALYELAVNSTTVFGAMSTGGGGSRRYVMPAVSISLSNWTHYALSYDGASLACYRNGVRLTNYNVGAFTMGSNGFPVCLGAGAYNTSVDAVKGFGDDFRIYNRALSTNEIITLSLQ